MRARYVEEEWVKLGSLEAHLKVSRTWDADFCSSRRCAMCLWDGTAMDEDDDDDDDDETLLRTTCLR